MYCEQCGAKNSDENLFCEQCGAKLVPAAGEQGPAAGGLVPVPVGAGQRSGGRAGQRSGQRAGQKPGQKNQRETAERIMENISDKVNVEGIANMARATWNDMLLMRGSQTTAAVVLAMILLIVWTYHNISVVFSLEGRPSEGLLNAIGAFTIIFFIAAIIMSGGLIFKAAQRYTSFGLPVYKQDLFWMPVATLASALFCIKSIRICGLFTTMDMNMVYSLSDFTYSYDYSYNGSYLAAMEEITRTADKIDNLIGEGMGDESFFLIFAAVVCIAVIVYPFVRDKIRGRI